MRLTLDPEQMKVCMDLWRHELALREAGTNAANFGRARRERTLDNLAGTLNGWLDLLRLCQPDEGDGREFKLLTQEVAHFKAWVDEARMAVALLQDARSVTPMIATEKAKRKRPGRVARNERLKV